MAGIKKPSAEATRREDGTGGVSRRQVGDYINNKTTRASSFASTPRNDGPSSLRLCFNLRDEQLMLSYLCNPSLPFLWARYYR
jgi:hypothetical protein